MRFKFLFILFNAVLGLSFLLLFFMPLPLLGFKVLGQFWAQNWFVAALFLAVMAGIDIYFVTHGKLFQLLEREDWDGLIGFLKAKLQRRGMLSVHQAKLYANACLIRQKPQEIESLRRLFATKNPKALPSLALLLALPAILGGKSQEILEFLTPLVQTHPKARDAGWWRWCLAFALLLEKDWIKAKETLYIVIEDAREPVLQLLALYLLNNLRQRDDEVPRVLDPLASHLKDRLTEAEWHRTVEHLKERVVLVLFLNKMIQDARAWLAEFPSGETK
ncbi:MAG: hypothetical protein HKM05_12350 [Spirochaetales bacterium]|nr:hypothetical protein [Spirochaetales bacterium]